MNQPLTTLERRSTPATQWSEEQKRAYLLQINRQENPTELSRLQQLFEQGHNANKAAQLCDEHGHLKYKDLQDPNALINRFEFIDVEHLENDPATGKKMTVLDREYFYPTVALIHQTRELVHQITKDQEIIAQEPELITAEDYRNYFARFHPDTLREIIQNMKSIEITQGCNGPCRKECYLGPEGPAKRHMPFEIVTWLIDQFMDLHPEIRGDSDIEFKREKTIMIFYATDLADYQYEGKTSADIYRYVRKKYGVELGKSISYSLAPATIEWIYQVAIVDNIGIPRISQLKSTNIPNPKERLIQKLIERAKRDGIMITGVQLHRISVALDQGIKTHLNTNVGPNMPETLEEKVMSQEMYHCFHGTVCRTGKGFIGTVLRPTTRLYKKQLMEIPLHPQSKKMHIPQFHEIQETMIPFAQHMKPAIVRPLFTVMSDEGKKIHVDSRTEGEVRLKQLGRIKDMRKKMDKAIYSETSEKNGRRHHGRISDAIRAILEKRNTEESADEKMLDYQRVAKAIANCCAELRSILEKSITIGKDIEGVIEKNAAAQIDLTVTIDAMMQDVNEIVLEFYHLGNELNKKAAVEMKKLREVIKKGEKETRRNRYLEMLYGALQEIVTKSDEALGQSVQEYTALLNAEEAFAQYRNELAEKCNVHRETWKTIGEAFKAKQ